MTMQPMMNPTMETRWLALPLHRSLQIVLSFRPLLPDALSLKLAKESALAPLALLLHQRRSPDLEVTVVKVALADRTVPQQVPVLLF